jgi:DNA polymerase III subunit beta
MEFTVSKSDLVRELNLSQGVVEKKTTIPILSNVLVEADGDRIVLTATDLELGIRCSCPAKVSKAGAGTIPARRLLDYVRLLPDADVNVKLAENQWASLLCGRSRTRIAGMSRESFPELPEMPEMLAEIPVAALASMIAKTIFAISSEESRFTLNGALLLLKSHGLTMVATDGHRLSMVDYPMELPTVSGSFRALLPRKAMTEILKLSGDAGPDAKIRFSGNDNPSDEPQADRQFPRFRTCAAEGSSARRDHSARRVESGHRTRIPVLRRAFPRYTRSGVSG